MVFKSVWFRTGGSKTEFMQIRSSCMEIAEVFIDGSKDRNDHFYFA